MSTTERADIALCERGLTASRSRAQSLIKGGCVLLNGKPLQKCSVPVLESDSLEVVGEVCPYVSRGGLKLEKALSAFQTDPAGKVCLDVGASTGGFTDVLLRNGAKHVYALDVGTSQLAEILRNDDRVTVMEQTNARTMTADMFPARPQLAVMDVSFISIKLILPALFDVLTEDATVISLIKPQFEAGKKAIGKNGIVSDKRVHEQVLSDLIHFAEAHGRVVEYIIHSPVTGSDGNIEFLASLTTPGKARSRFEEKEIRALVLGAHLSFK